MLELSAVPLMPPKNLDALGSFVIIIIEGFRYSILNVRRSKIRAYPLPA